MKRGIATPERNTLPSLTIPVRTRSPIEAFKMLRQGQPIDQAVGYYEDHGIEVEKDFFLMDKVEKLHKLAEYRDRMARHKSDYEDTVAWATEYKNNLKQKEDEQKEQSKPGGASDPGAISK